MISVSKTCNAGFPTISLARTCGLWRKNQSLDRFIQSQPMTVDQFLAKGKQEIKDWFEALFIRNLPGTTGIHVRRWYYQRQFSQSSVFSIAVGCRITAPENISLGNLVSIMHYCCLYAHDKGQINLGNRVSLNSNVLIDASQNGQIDLGNDVLIGPNVVLRASNHRYESKSIPIIQQGHSSGKIIIGQGLNNENRIYENQIDSYCGKRG